MKTTIETTVPDTIPIVTTEKKQKYVVQPWIVIRSEKKKEQAYPPVIMPCENHGYIKAKHFDFL